MSKELQLYRSNRVAIVDDSNYARLLPFKWYVNPKETVIYRRIAKDSVAYNFSLASEVMGFPGVLFDHRDRNPFNNQEANLRRATRAQNQANRAKYPGCSSIYKGVSWHAKRRRWQVNIKFESTKIRFADFKNELLAALAYDAKARELHGEFATPNFSIT